MELHDFSETETILMQDDHQNAIESKRLGHQHAHFHDQHLEPIFDCTTVT